MCISSAFALLSWGIVVIAPSVLRLQFQPFELPLICELHHSFRNFGVFLFVFIIEIIIYRVLLL